MDSSAQGMTGLTTGQIMATQVAATERVERARVAVRISELRIEASVKGLPLREQVRDYRRLATAEAELQAAEAAYEAAQDIDFPDADL
jgi:hypothetical protein